MKKFFIGLVVFILIAIGSVVALVATGNLKFKDFNFSTNVSFDGALNKSVNITKPANMSFDNILIQKAGKNELKELTAFADEYLKKIDSGDDVYVYNNMLHTGFYKQYSLENISQMHNVIRTWGGVKSYDLDKAEITIKKDKDGRNYKIKMPVEYANGLVEFSMQLVDENQQLKVLNFNFKPVK